MQNSAINVRQQFIDFFKQFDHRFIPSSPVVPQDDPTLLFTNAGMNQFKAIFLGENKQGLKRVCNSQKCMRVSGKHNDLEEVGIDHHHHTFFEMLGNWSFGDYYKKEAIQWAWQLLTDVFKLPKQQMYATVYTDDDAAETIWKNDIDIIHSHIGRYPAKYNFWEMGDTGPCGPCTELHFDLGPGTCLNEKQSSHTCGVNVDGCGRYIEIWNLVFIQYNREKDGTLVELPNKHVDTGMGFERLLRVIQGVNSNYATDLFQPVITYLESSSGKKYGYGEEGIPFRVIADHIRSLLFSITDGAIPSNEGRGYVVRRLLRRAYRFGRKLGFQEPFLHTLIPTVVSVMGDAFPEVVQRQEYVSSVIRAEEERFDQTLELGLEKIHTMIGVCKTEKKSQLSGGQVFQLYDTYGFPMDLTRLIAAEQNLGIDEHDFENLMEQQRTRGRQALKASQTEGLSAEGWIELQHNSGTEFVGYTQSLASVKVCKYKLKNVDGDTSVLCEGFFILDKTPFYAEMGGQMGDTGFLTTSKGDTIEVVDTIKWNDLIVHKVKTQKPIAVVLLSGPLSAHINENRRLSIMRHHSATHLLQSALRKVLGEHVNQSGSRVWESGLRFDFTHFQAMTQTEINEAESLVNQWIMDNISIATQQKRISEAKQEGAIALFGEKYGEEVRVVSMGDVSKEFCGGTHVGSTGMIGSFHIISESSIAAGIRRVEAICGHMVLDYLHKRESIVAELCMTLKVNEEHLIAKIGDLVAQVKDNSQQLEILSQQILRDEVHTLMLSAKQQKGFEWAVQFLGNIQKKKFSDLVNAISDALRKPEFSSTTIVLGALIEENVQIAACCGNNAIKKHQIHCGDLVKIAVSKVNGNGGGSPSRAMAGGKDATKIHEALNAVEQTLQAKARLV